MSTSPQVANTAVNKQAYFLLALSYYSFILSISALKITNLGISEIGDQSDFAIF
jgi:hypothetical protein